MVGSTPQTTVKLRLLDDSNTSAELPLSDVQEWLGRELGLTQNN